MFCVSYFFGVVVNLSANLGNFFEKKVFLLEWLYENEKKQLKILYKRKKSNNFVANFEFTYK